MRDIRNYLTPSLYYLYPHECEKKEYWTYLKLTGNNLVLNYFAVLSVSYCHYSNDVTMRLEKKCEYEKQINKMHFRYSMLVFIEWKIT